MCDFFELFQIVTLGKNTVSIFQQLVFSNFIAFFLQLPPSSLGNNASDSSIVLESRVGCIGDHINFLQHHVSFYHFYFYFILESNFQIFFVKFEIKWLEIFITSLGVCKVLFFLLFKPIIRINRFKRVEKLTFIVIFFTKILSFWLF